MARPNPKIWTLDPEQMLWADLLPEQELARAEEARRIKELETEWQAQRDQVIRSENERRASVSGVARVQDRATRQLKGRVVGEAGAPAPDEVDMPTGRFLWKTIQAPLRGASFGLLDRLHALDREATHQGRAGLFFGDKEDPDYGAIPDATYGEELDEQRLARARQPSGLRMLETVGAIGMGSRLPVTRVAGPEAGVGARLLSRAARVGEGAGYGAGLAALEGQDPVKGAAWGGGLAGVGEGLGEGFTFANKAAQHVADRMAVLSLDASRGDVDALRNRFGTPSKAGQYVRSATDESGKRLLPTMASSETRYQRLSDHLNTVATKRNAVLSEAARKGATVDPLQLAGDAEGAVQSTVGSAPVRVGAGGEGAKRARDLIARFREEYHRPARVMTDANGQPLVSQTVNEIDALGGHDPDLSKVGGSADWTGRLEGSGLVPVGKNVGPGKRAALRVEDQFPTSEPFDATKHSTTRPAPGTGWKPMIKPEEPMSLDEARRFQSWLQAQVDATEKGSPKVADEAERAFMSRFAHRIGMRIEDSIYRGLGEPALRDYLALNQEYSNAVTLQDMLRGKANRPFVGLPDRQTSYRLLHMVPGGAYIPQAAQGAAEQAGRLFNFMGQQGAGGLGRGLGIGVGVAPDVDKANKIEEETQRRDKQKAADAEIQKALQEAADSDIEELLKE